MFVVSVFSIEYMARIYAAENRLKFIFSFYGIIDLLAIFPYYLATGMDLRSLRVLRVLRLARILKFTRYTDALDRMGRAFWLIRNELVMFFVITFCFLYISALGIYYFENPVQPDEFKSVFHSLWWSVITITQVGYGDVYPITAGGRLFTFGVLLIGLMMMAVPTGLIASALTKTIGDE
ncbi:MAG: ion transporter [Balneolaceae bacterium]|nr:ion transporter [Balneolaceae bacterium]